MPDNFRSVSLFTIKPDDPLPFPIAIHYKGRYIVYRKPGETLETAKYNRFIYKRIGRVYIPEEEFGKFESYQAAKRAEEEKVLDDAGASVEQKYSHRISQQLSVVTRDLFDGDSGKNAEEAVKDVLDVTSDTVKQVLSKPYLRVFESIPEKSSTIITHSMRVSLLSTYLGYQLGFVNPVGLEYMAAAALLHDIGKTRLQLSDDLNVSEDDESEMEIMKQHPIESVKMLEQMPFVPEEVMRIILEHHECRDGTGYPNGIRGPKMHKLSKVFIIANTFDNLVSSLPGDRNARYAEAANIMSSKMRSQLDPTLLPKAIRTLISTTQVKTL